MSRASTLTVGSREPTRRGVLWLGLPCDVRCKFCYDEHLPRSAKVWLNMEEISQALTKFKSYYGNEYVDFMGGEPTLHPKVTEVVRLAAQLGLKPTIITHGMRLADERFARGLAEAGIHDFLVSIHGVGETVDRIHGKGRGHHERQMRALRTLVDLGVPFRFNVTVIRDNLFELSDIVELARIHGASVVNFLTFNPYFEWQNGKEIDFQVPHWEAARFLQPALQRAESYGIEANVRYMPLCQLDGYERHVYTGFQLPFDHHEWDYNSWYDSGYRGRPGVEWYREAAERQRQRHHYRHVPECAACAAQTICDGFHEQYIARWPDTRAKPYPGEMISDPRHFISHQAKAACAHNPADPAVALAPAEPLRATQFEPAIDRAGVRRQKG